MDVDDDNGGDDDDDDDDDGMAMTMMKISFSRISNTYIDSWPQTWPNTWPILSTLHFGSKRLWSGSGSATEVDDRQCFTYYDDSSCGITVLTVLEEFNGSKIMNYV